MPSPRPGPMLLWSEWQFTTSMLVLRQETQNPISPGFEPRILNVYVANWKITMLLMGKSTINGPFQ